MSDTINDFFDSLEKENLSGKEMREKIDEFIKQNNIDYEDLADEEDLEDLYYYLDMAFQAETEQEAIKYAKKALKIEPDNIDAQVIIAENSIYDHIKLLNKFEKIKKAVEQKLVEEHLLTEENIGNFWLLTETRPYMRLLYNRMRLLLDCGKIGMAKNACLEILDLNNDDNLGARFILMHIYAYFEDEKSAVKLFERYDCQKSTQFLLPLSTLYYKLGKTRKATAYIKELVDINKDTHNFFNRLVIGEGLSDVEFGMYGYLANSIEELVIDVTDNKFLFVNCGVYFKWVLKTIKSID